MIERWFFSLVIIIFLYLCFGLGCSSRFNSQPCAPGEAGCACRDDGKCENGLSCGEEGVCIESEQKDAGDAGDDTDSDNDTIMDTEIVEDDSETTREESSEPATDSDTRLDTGAQEDTGTDVDGGEPDTDSGGDTDVGEGAYYTGEYRNLFAEIGKSSDEIQAKIDETWTHFFYGEAFQRVYFPDGDKAYILDTGNNDVRSEGMSYGMMIAVQLDKKAEFDRIWNWARTYMYYDSGRYAGWFGWQNSITGERIDVEPSPASDGDEYIAMALLFASHRWGDGEGIYDYGAEANNLLSAMLHQEDDGVGVNMFDTDSDIVVFCPVGSSAEFTDPSYVLPGFYRLFAEWAEQDNERWRDIADAGRAFLARSTHPSTGLNPDYAHFDGTPFDPTGSGHEHFKQDAWRVAVNIGFDHGWFGVDPWQETFADTIQGFFYEIGLGKYGSQFQLDGEVLNPTRNIGLIAANAVPGLATDSERSREFTEAFWKLNPPSGTWRYYDGLLYFLSLLHVSGEFKIWKP